MNFEKEMQSGIVSSGNYYREGNIILISNYWGMDNFMSAPLSAQPPNILYISTASKPYLENRIPAPFLDAEKAWLDKKQNSGKITFREFCLSDKEPSAIEEALDSADAILMGGGNTPYLLEKLQDSGAIPIIKQRVQDGTWYFGKSAGAIIAGPNIEPRGFFLNGMNTKPLESTKSLGLTQVYPLPHIDTPSIMESVYKGRTGWQHAEDMARKFPVVHLQDNKN